MAKVLGVGGVFFRSEDGSALADWYARWLGMEIDPSFGGAMFRPGQQPSGGFTLWTPFAADTTYFGRAEQSYMINLVVDDVRAAIEQVREGGAEIAGDIEDSEFGAFGWFVDPDGNRVELWQPPLAD